MKEYKWSVGLRHKATRERLNVTVWAPTNDEATHKLCGVLIGPECDYEWTGTGPVYENNQTVSREVQTAPETGFEVDPEQVNPALKPHQQDAVIWAFRGGRRALFESFGLGKTVQELEWCRLTAAYEDTGLGPEEVSEYQRLCDSYAKAGLDAKFVQFCIDATQNGLSMDRIRELAQAEKDGRLKVIPCNVGETLWSLYNYPASGICRIVVAEISIFKNITVISADNYGMIPEKEIGKTVFLTREEAEAALKKRKEADDENEKVDQ